MILDQEVAQTLGEGGVYINLTMHADIFEKRAMEFNNKENMW
jgi:hypothetical protein